VADQVPIQTNEIPVGVGNDFGVGEFDEVSVILNQLVVNSTMQSQSFSACQYGSKSSLCSFPRSPRSLSFE